jgi:hypothetical protein
MARRFHRGWRAVTSPRTRGGRGALLLVAATLTVFVPALSYVAAAGEGHGVVGRWNHYPSERAAARYVVTNVSCARRTSPRSLRTMFVSRLRPVLGLDNPHVIELGGERYLWLFNDTYVDYTDRAASLLDAARLNNAALLQENGCFRLVHGGSRTDIRSFEHGTVDSDEHYFWPLGGEVFGGRLRVFWAEMLSTRDRPHPPSDGLNRHPLRTWLATYDARSLRRLSFRPAPNDGVFPEYGFAVASDGQFTYLFGNSNLLDYSLEGGFFGGPHSATRMYLARVPRGRLDLEPEYRTARRWSDDQDDAVPISDRFSVENGMQPRYLEGRWVAVTKVNGFAGADTIVEVAKHPWGPWRIVSRRSIEPRRGFEVMNNYQPIILPYRAASGDLMIVISQNAHHWPDAVKDFSMYRPHVYAEPWPFDD